VTTPNPHPSSDPAGGPGEATGLTCPTCHTPDVIWIAPGGREAVCLECGDLVQIDPGPHSPRDVDPAGGYRQEEIN
jgi:hypothetical protein